MIVLTKIVTSFKQASIVQLNMMMVRTMKPPKQVDNSIATKLRSSNFITKIDINDEGNN